MSSFAKLTPPADGKPVKVENGKMVIPDNPIIPFIRGDGMGPDIWKACELVFNAAVKKAYQGQKKIAWMRLYAGLDALQQYGQDQILPEDTLKAIRTYLIAIKGPLTTPVGEYPYVCMSCALEQGSPDAPRPLKCSQCGSEYITKKFRSMNVALRQMLDL
ncbi:MAG TPA: isocitrate/isopropylmalate family dehydrogenase, partial [Spirochaetota bacterium]|nr:isocitrate/isopropylmalate family dehydrogenase [Spirochaetota bacterium]